MRMRFATRAFLLSFVPFALLLTGSFWVIQKRVAVTVRDGLRSSLREAHVSMARMREKSEIQNHRFLKIVGESAALKAGLQLIQTEPTSKAARLTLEDQLREIAEALRFDLLLVSSIEGRALAGVMRIRDRDGRPDQLVAMDGDKVRPPRQGFFTLGGHTYQITSIPVDQGEESIATLSIGEQFDLKEFSSPTVLVRNGEVLLSSIEHVSHEDLEAALRHCSQGAECEVALGGETYLTLPQDSISFGDGHQLRTLQSIDSANRPVEQILRGVFTFTGFGALLAALILTGLSSRSIVEPIAALIAHLRDSERTGLLPDFQAKQATIQEIRELMASFSRAAAAIRDGREKLQNAYVEFVGSLASALDARDDYTAGHSRRVSEYSCAIAEALGLPAQQLEEIRIGALLHDIGKVGIADSVLRKPGRLTAEELALLQQHPTIGRRILEGVQGFQPYLPVVELHHENWDGTGYPFGLPGESSPLLARIVHVADAYDAMTSDRPYRPGRSHEAAVSELERCSGTQFDPAIVAAFVKLEGVGRRRPAEPARPRLHLVPNPNKPDGEPPHRGTTIQ